MKIEIIVLSLSLFSTGLMAGIFFTWSNAVTPGIGKLNDLEYLRALQSMNRVILNTAFRIVFIGAVITVALVPVFLFKTSSNNSFMLSIGAFVIYWIGVFGITFLGNIPLNRLLDASNLETISRRHSKTLRTTIETKWNTLNWIRTITSVITFLLLIISFLFINK